MYCHCSHDGKLEERQSRTKEHGCINTNALIGEESSPLDAQGLTGTLLLEVSSSIQCFLSSYYVSGTLLDSGTVYAGYGNWGACIMTGWGSGRQGSWISSHSNFIILQMKTLETPVDQGFASGQQLCCYRLDLAENLLSKGVWFDLRCQDF